MVCVHFESIIGLLCIILLTWHFSHGSRRFLFWWNKIITWYPQDTHPHPPHTPVRSSRSQFLWSSFLRVLPGLLPPSVWPLGLLYVYSHNLWVFTRSLVPSVLAFSLSSHRDPYICILFNSRFTSCNKHKKKPSPASWWTYVHHSRAPRSRVVMLAEIVFLSTLDMTYYSPFGGIPGLHFCVLLVSRNLDYSESGTVLGHVVTYIRAWSVTPISPL